MPGQPVLPDLTVVSGGDKQLAIAPSASCPYSTDVFQTSASAALGSVANLSIYASTLKWSRKRRIDVDPFISFVICCLPYVTERLVLTLLDIRCITFQE